MINYIIQVLLFQALFLAVYDFFLQKETFFKWNRTYLLITPFLAFIIPLLKFESIQRSIPQEFVVQLPTVFLNPQAFIDQTTINNATIDYLNIAFYLGFIFFSLLFLTRLFKILKLISINEVIKKGDFNLVLIAKKQSAFSFFNYIFINKQLFKNKELEIIQHELVHCRQKHTIDLLVFELLKIVMWFNPLVYVYQKRITLLHEYISDAEVVKETNKSIYFNKLLSETFNVENISFINQFFKQSLIKKRIVMIVKEKSQKIKQLKYLLIVPLLFGMLTYSSCEVEEKDKLVGIESVANNIYEYPQYKYYNFKEGKTYIGQSILIDSYISLAEYSETEKELHNIINLPDNLTSYYLVIINYEGERVNFLNTMDRSNLKDKDNQNKEDVESEPVSLPMIENAPVFPGCEGTEEELRKCLQEKITTHVSLNFNSKLANRLSLESRVHRIFVMFIIDKEGEITDVKARAPRQELEEEAMRVVNLLPKMIPGKQKGKNVGVKYSLPIAFKVDGKKDNKVKNGVSNGNPLYILEGKEISKEDMGKINPDNIKSINVLKDESATTKYGDKGKNGVVEIVIKK